MTAYRLAARAKTPPRIPTKPPFGGRLRRAAVLHHQGLLAGRAVGDLDDVAPEPLLGEACGGVGHLFAVPEGAGHAVKQDGVTGYAGPTESLNRIRGRLWPAVRPTPNYG